jgi:hypothetical protein
MTVLDDALDLVRRGFWVFPIRPNDKKPSVKEWQNAATQDPARLREWFGDANAAGRLPNIGLSTGRFKLDSALLVVDVDVKKGKDGNQSLLQLELEGYELPDTLTAETPTGGRHLFFSVDAPVRQGTDTIGKGLDVRSRGGYVLGAGSSIDGRPYRWLLDTDIQPATAWITDRCGVAPRVRDRRQDQEPIQVDATRALSRAREYLLRDAPIAEEGNAGDQTTYKVACRIKDMGVGEDAAVAVLLDHWNPRCSPPWSGDELAEKVRNAYRYGAEAPGVAAPEADFRAVETSSSEVEGDAGDEADHPLAWINEKHAYITLGNTDAVLRETVDADGQFELKFLAVAQFHRKYAAKKWQPSKKIERQTEGWMEWSGRREYEGLVFMPGQDAPPDRYNLWRGFAPLADTLDVAMADDALQRYLGHIKNNVCCGDAAVYDWVVGFLAHLVQKPWHKPHVALVIRGRKGTGKNFFVERICDLLGAHAMVVARKRFLTGTFTSHLERLLMFVLDEAFWSGDKEVEGILKDLITGSHHQIEKKGLDTYPVRNLTRVVILGNEDWLVPASQDERRFCVLNIGDARRRDTAFFEQLKIDMRAGGNKALLSYLMAYDLTGFDVNTAPMTAALREQKVATLPPLGQWWLDCLSQGRLIGSDFAEEWPTESSADRMRKAFRNYMRDLNVTARLPTDSVFGRDMHRMASALDRKRTSTGYVYYIPTLAECRSEFEAYLGQRMEWPE